jgi:hypothetical protein
MTRTLNIANYFQRYAWTYEEVDEDFWRSTFSTEREADFDLYVMPGEEWVHFAVSPFCAKPEPACHARLYEALLRLNQQMRLAHFAVDDDGDVNLLAEAPRRGFAYHQFAAILDAMVGYTSALAADVARVATEPNFYSPRIPLGKDAPAVK